MKQGLAEIVLVLDRSGSMKKIASDMEGAIEEVLNKQKDTYHGDIQITFIRFDDQYEEVFHSKPIKEVKDIKLEPRNMTALLDAIGRTINNVGQRFSNVDENDRPERVLFIIITDGLENSSHKFSRKQVFEMIDHQRNNYNWEFTFIGANQDAIQEGGRMGIHRGSSLSYVSSRDGVISMSRSLGEYTSDFLSNGRASYDDD